MIVNVLIGPNIEHIQAAVGPLAVVSWGFYAFVEINNDAVQEPVGDRFCATKNQQLARNGVLVSC